MLAAASGEGTTLTGLTYRCNSNFNRTKKYAELLMSKGFLTSKGRSPKVYLTTKRGSSAMKILEDVTRILLS